MNCFFIDNNNHHLHKSNKEEKFLFLVALQNYLDRHCLTFYCNYFFLPLYSSETVSFARPLARRAANTRRPFLVAILSRKPCLFFLFLLEGWNVLFIVLYIYMFLFKKCFMLFSVQNYSFFLEWQRNARVFLPNRE